VAYKKKPKNSGNKQTVLKARRRRRSRGSGSEELGRENEWDMESGLG
jgi:hypothetical protein